MIISVASGKGGTGKTLVSTNLAASIGSNVTLLDCDVEEPNAHLFIEAASWTAETVFTPVPRVDPQKCTYCGKCEEICEFKSIVTIKDAVLTFPELCHSCGGCQAVCPEGAITETGRELGVIRKGDRKGVNIVDGSLRVGEVMAPPLIRQVRAYARPDRLTIIDAPPGTSCPVVVSIKDTDFVLLVTEPTPFGLHDLKLALAVVKNLDVPHALIINRSDLGDDKVRLFADQEDLPILMEIPFDRGIAELYARGHLLVEYLPEWHGRFLQLFEKITDQITHAGALR